MATITATETQTATTLELLPDGSVPPAWVADIYRAKPFEITREELAQQLAATFARLLQGVDLAEVHMATDSGKQTFLVVRHGDTWAANQWRRLNSKARLNFQR